MSESTIPRPALWLGLAGLLPSIAALVVMLAMPGWRGAAASAGLGYGAVIASFVGGSWWGLAAARGAPDTLARFLSLAVVPSLVAWMAVLAPPMTGFCVLALLFVVLPPTDARLSGEGISPPWWLALRRPLSFAMAALQAAMALVLLLNPAG